MRRQGSPESLKPVKGKVKQHWTKVHLGIQPEVLLGILCVLGWVITWLLDEHTEVLTSAATLLY